ncbi:helix-turn-helix domain-containing protein [Rhizobium sp. GN54]|uniref:helix-turn-helix domain-containing protein n=1 Tax=Rhizobium sp. GN54 TaxID=2898150 RepID=UPI001E48F8A6|nr:helix-turn-helix domain-containing protein [Rhizobium sp. GN54]MCD2184664.1 helix-turn-helix domain-containing protein [Rhizobium sp. GN54]
MGTPQPHNQALDTRIREDRFTTLVKDKAEQFPCWRNLVASIAEVERGEHGKQGFDATVRAHDLGRLHIASLRVDAMRYRRTPQLIRRSRVDHWQLALRRSGSEFSSSSGHVLRSSAGSLELRSLTMPSIAHSTAGETICIWLKRDNFAAMAGSLDAASHRPIQGPMKNIMQEFILTLERYRSTLTHRDVPAAVGSLTALLGALVKPTQDGFEAAATPIAASQLAIARKYVDANLASPTLGVGDLCRALGVSRRKLYYLFEHCGGVSSFIRERRLAACHAVLEDIADVRLISTIAYDHGFADPAQFSRQFRAHFGYSPKDAREFRLCGHVIQPGVPSSFAQWLLQVQNR